MFDLRYHVASLAAVFLALVIGILVGVGIADRGVREDALRADVAKWKKSYNDELETATLLEQQQAGTQDFIKNSYDALMARRLEGKRVALVFVGSTDGDVQGSVERTLENADGRLGRLRALRLPIDRHAVLSGLPRPLRAHYAGNDGLEALGADLAAELVDGGDTPLWNTLAVDLVEEQEGTLAKPVDAVVVARTTTPQRGATGRLLTGFYAGLGQSGVPAVGVENSTTATTAIGLYRRHGLSSVDDLERPTGRLALALLLAGGDKGQYGLRRTDDGLMPKIEPLPTSG